MNTPIANAIPEVSAEQRETSHQRQNDQLPSDNKKKHGQIQNIDSLSIDQQKLTLLTLRVDLIFA